MVIEFKTENIGIKEINNEFLSKYVEFKRHEKTHE
jgi:hypothetical protein